jgi:hypothetical protein
MAEGHLGKKSHVAPFLIASLDAACNPNGHADAARYPCIRAASKRLQRVARDLDLLGEDALTLKPQTQSTTQSHPTNSKHGSTETETDSVVHVRGTYL